MFETAFTLGLTQFARSLSFPERLQHRAARNGVLEAWRVRNTGLDGLFYDVKTLTAEEVYYLSDAIAAEGLILIVPPGGGAMLTICDSIDEYLARGGRDVHVLAIAGLGGSAIGAAAFARNVADAVGEPVAAVVSGYGLGDIVSETMGANFLFGWLSTVRSECEVIDDVVGRPHLGAYESRHALARKSSRSCLDVDTVQSLLADEHLSFRLLAGHSRGNLVLSQALYALKAEKPARVKAIAAGARIVTFGARITMPPDFRSVIDVIGELDWYGEINSRPMIDSDIKVPMAGHSTNTDMLGALRVTTLLRSILTDTPKPIPPREIAPTALVLVEPPQVPASVQAPAMAAKEPETAKEMESVVAAGPETPAPTPAPAPSRRKKTPARR
ncbi:hypothetical protein M8R20_08290 [Pseudomonas sp. R2.Fl]|nr:hypothetical protein [Pseudomonas sp. R2.Fl]